MKSGNFVAMLCQTELACQGKLRNPRNFRQDEFSGCRSTAPSSVAREIPRDDPSPAERTFAFLANVAGVDLTEAVMKKYGSGCPGCAQFICTCDDAEKP